MGRGTKKQAPGSDPRGRRRRNRNSVKYLCHGQRYNYAAFFKVLVPRAALQLRGLLWGLDFSLVHRIGNASLEQRGVSFTGLGDQIQRVA